MRMKDVSNLSEPYQRRYSSLSWPNPRYRCSSHRLKTCKRTGQFLPLDGY